MFDSLQTRSERLKSERAYLRVRMREERKRREGERELEEGN